MDGEDKRECCGETLRTVLDRDDERDRKDALLMALTWVHKPEKVRNSVAIRQEGDPRTRCVGDYCLTNVLGVDSPSAIVIFTDAMTTAFDGMWFVLNSSPTLIGSRSR